MAFLQAHLFDLDLALRELVFAEDDGEGHAVHVGCFELVGELGLDFVEEFGLLGRALVSMG